LQLLQVLEAQLHETSTNPNCMPLFEFEVEANCCIALAQFHKQYQQQQLLYGKHLALEERS
jgi:hypothetical protein